MNRAPAHPVAPSKAESDLLEPFDAQPLSAITLVSDLSGAERLRPLTKRR